MINLREVCGPGPCPLVPAPEECWEETKTVRKKQTDIMTPTLHFVMQLL